MSYSEESYLMLSGLQHFSFCRRQWALIHIEEAWNENLRTTEGRIMHQRAHDTSIYEKRGDIVTVRGVSISSAKLGISGECDVLEYHAYPNGVAINNLEGTWIPYPVEYKRGIPKDNPADKLQLCAQAMCLEEMLCCDIGEGALYYGELRRREVVPFSNELRQLVKVYLEEMHHMYERGYTPKAKITKSCNACSLKELCLPKLMNRIKVADYLSEAMEESE